ncbi:hypothetical protein FNV43_RR20754 [Rhamnella rubrinervis]|uniref:Uncharacterized protein n=1 Tax=Rhamnella rubrinervis TaxID=2594499 RepID=A0A8K0GUV0_9ROSA|nr:hypothetical protein FNV43_RR20754 [Rhamnella rubrinervis]
MSSTVTGTHVLVYPYPAPGHIIPLLDLTRILLTRGFTVTFIVTSKHLSLLQPLFSTYPPSSLQSLVLSVPDTTVSKSVRLVAIIRATREQHYPVLFHWFKSHPSPPVAIISDSLFSWTNDLASEIGIQRLVFSPSGAVFRSLSFSLWSNLPRNNNPDDVYTPISFPKVPNSPVYPWWQLSFMYRSGKGGDPDWELFRSMSMANRASWGAVFNSFAAMEGAYLEHLKEVMGHNRVWAVGPLLPLDDDVVGASDRGGPSSLPSNEVTSWLDAREFRSAVFVCFGSRTILTRSQMEVLSDSLEQSGVQFILSVRGPNERQAGNDHGEIQDGFGDRVADRGLVIKGWAPQVAILRHRAVGAFLTHCGWNSLIEGLTAGTVMLTWPMRADQFTNAKLLVDHLGVGIRVGEGTEIVPESNELARLLVESLKEDRPERIQAKNLSEAALSAVIGGSSGNDLDELVKRLSELEKRTTLA